MATALPPSKTEELLAPLLSSLPAASISPTPPDALLPLLSPILRQRVQLLSSSNTDPWLPLLCYDTSKVKSLEQVITNEKFEPHPVSGQVEIDWDFEVEVGYKRIDEETLHAEVRLRELGLVVQLVWCTGDEVGGGDGWRIGQVLVLDPSASASTTQASIPLAEEVFESKSHAMSNSNLAAYGRGHGRNTLLTPDHTGDLHQDEDDDADYWAQYDNTPARTPATKRSPAPPSALPPHLTALQSDLRAHADNAEDEESYFAQYASVQPAMDNNDPDEERQNGGIESSLGKNEISPGFLAKGTVPNGARSIGVSHDAPADEDSNPWSEDSPIFSKNLATSTSAPPHDEELLHPRPASAHSTNSSSGNSSIIDKLEQHASKLENGYSNKGRELSEVGIRQHIGTSVKSLYRLARVAGIDRTEFERIVGRELECLSLMDEDD